MKYIELICENSSLSELSDIIKKVFEGNFEIIEEYVDSYDMPFMKHFVIYEKNEKEGRYRIEMFSVFGKKLTTKIIFYENQNYKK